MRLLILQAVQTVQGILFELVQTWAKKGPADVHLAFYSDPSKYEKMIVLVSTLKNYYFLNVFYYWNKALIIAVLNTIFLFSFSVVFYIPHVIFSTVGGGGSPQHTIQLLCFHVCCHVEGYTWWEFGTPPGKRSTILSQCFDSAPFKQEDKIHVRYFTFKTTKAATIVHAHFNITGLLVVTEGTRKLGVQVTGHLLFRRGFPFGLAPTHCTQTVLDLC